jgi:hypothetical protein
MKLRILIFSLLIIFLSLGTIASALENNSAKSEANKVQPPVSESNSEIDADEDCHCFKERFFVHGDRRTDRALQVQINLTGAGLNRFGYGPGGGIYLGYQITRLMAIGLTSQTFYNDHNYWSDHDSYKYDHENTYLGQEGVKKSASEIDPRHLLEMRFFPWDFGLYFSGGILHVGKQKSTIEFKKQNRTIGENEYNTGMTAELDYQAWTGAAAGIGYNYIFQNGISLSAGFNAGFGILTPEVEVSSTSAVTDEDMEDWRDQIKRNEQSIPFMFQFGFGYAF